MKFNLLKDRLLHEDYYANKELLLRVNVLVFACLLTSLFSLTYAFISIYFSFTKAVYITLADTFGFVLILYGVRRKAPLILLGNIYIFLSANTLFFLTYFSGGMWSAIFSWIIAIPLTALLVVNRNSGLFWGAVSFAIMLVFGLMSYYGHEFPVEYDPRLKTQWYLALLPGLLLIISLIGLTFESIQSKALKDLSNLNKLLKGQKEHQKETIHKQSSELQKLLEEKNNIISMLSHDLRGSFANVQSLANMIEDCDQPDQSEEMLRLITKTSGNALQIIKKALDLQMSDKHNANITLEPVHAEVVIAEVIGIIRESAEQKHIRIVFSNNSSGVQVLADTTYLSLIIENLLSNAIKFSEKNNVVEIGLSRKNDVARISVKDNGPGIKPEEAGLLFKKFSQLSTRPTAGESSVGLGLSLVKMYAEILGGEVWHDPDYKDGALFVFEIPVVSATLA